MAGANILTANHVSCPLALHWSRGNTHLTVTLSVTLYYKKNGFFATLNIISVADFCADSKSRRRMIVAVSFHVERQKS